MAIDPNGNLATTAFNRFGLGARFDLADADRATILKDPRGWLKSQAEPTRALLSNPDLQNTKFNLLADIAEQQRKKMERDAKSQSAMAPTSMAPSAMGQTAMAAPAANGMPNQMAQPAMAQIYGPKPRQRYDVSNPDFQIKVPPIQRDVLMTEARIRAQKAFDDTSGFTERLVWFWSNHFAVSIAKGQQVTISAGSFEREAIRPHVLGRFADMLKAVEQHPTMLFYLDNRDSIGPSSKAGQRLHKGLNENLAREIMELHTLGVGGGYTQADVTSFANVITGWTWVGPNNPNFEPATFIFNPNTHEPGTHKVFGKTYGQEGIAQGEAVLTDLALAPATAKHIATKFARHFVADDPPSALVAKLAKAFTQSGGDLKAMTYALLDDDSAWQAPAEKLRSPQEFLMASARALNLPPLLPQPLLKAMNDLGQPLWRPPGPNGYGDRTQDWASPEGLKTRLGYAAMMAKLSQLTANPVDISDIVLASSASTETRQAISRAESRAQGLALLIMSPEFQRR